MDTCIYCDSKLVEKTREHVFPQFLGGSNCPSEFIIDDVCKCNHRLGATVDIAFAKCWPIAAALSQIDVLGWRTGGDFPLSPMGILQDIDSQFVPEGYVVELWLGPNGESVFWVRPHSIEFCAFVGGDPRLTKTKPSELYILLNSRSGDDIEKLIIFLRNVKKKVTRNLKGGGKSIKKIMCTRTIGLDVTKLGFAQPDETQSEFSKYLMDYCKSGIQRHFPALYDFNSIHMFFSKLITGLNFVLFGRDALATNYVKALKDFLAGKIKFEDSPVSLALGWGKDIGFKPTLAGAITLSVYTTSDMVVAALCVNELNVFVFEINRVKDVCPEKLASIRQGIFIAFYKPLNTFVKCSFDEYLDHINGIKLNEKIQSNHCKILSLGG